MVYSFSSAREELSHLGKILREKRRKRVVTPVSQMAPNLWPRAVGYNELRTDVQVWSLVSGALKGWLGCPVRHRYSEEVRMAVMNFQDHTPGSGMAVPVLPIPALWRQRLKDGKLRPTWDTV